MDGEFWFYVLSSTFVVGYLVWLTSWAFGAASTEPSNDAIQASAADPTTDPARALSAFDAAGTGLSNYAVQAEEAGRAMQAMNEAFRAIDEATTQEVQWATPDDIPPISPIGGSPSLAQMDLSSVEQRVLALMAAGHGDSPFSGGPVRNSPLQTYSARNAEAIINHEWDVRSHEYVVSITYPPDENGELFARVYRVTPEGLAARTYPASDDLLEQALSHLRRRESEAGAGGRLRDGAFRVPFPPDTAPVRAGEQRWREVSRRFREELLRIPVDANGRREGIFQVQSGPSSRSAPYRYAMTYNRVTMQRLTEVYDERNHLIHSQVDPMQRDPIMQNGGAEMPARLGAQAWWRRDRLFSPLAGELYRSLTGHPTESFVHPEAGKAVTSRKISRSLAGIPVVNVRAADGSVERKIQQNAAQSDDAIQESLRNRVAINFRGLKHGDQNTTQDSRKHYRRDGPPKHR